MLIFQFPTKKSVGALVYLPLEWSSKYYHVRNIIMYGNGKIRMTLRLNAAKNTAYVQKKYQVNVVESHSYQQMHESFREFYIDKLFLIIFQQKL